MDVGITEIKDLQIGDLVLVSGYEIRCVEILRLPQLRTKQSMYPPSIQYKAIKCRERYDIIGLKIPNREIYYDFTFHKPWKLNKEDYGNNS